MNDKNLKGHIVERQEWFLAKELVGIAGLPNSQQGIHKRARAQSWKKRTRLGIKGGSLEYHYSSLPIEVQQELGFVEVRSCIDDQVYKSAQELLEGYKKDNQELLNQIELEKWENEQIVKLETFKMIHPFFDLEDLTKQERVLLDSFRKLPNKGKEFILSQIELLSPLFNTNSEAS